MINFLKSDVSNIVFVTNQLLEAIKVRVNLRTLSNKLEAHAAYPSLLAVSECLKDLKVSNQTYRIDKDTYNPTDLLFPFITHYSPGGGRFVLVHSISNGKVKITDENNRNKYISEIEFLKSWEGVAFFAESNEDSGEKNYYQNRIYSLLKDVNFPVFFIATFTGIFLIFTSKDFFWPNLALGFLYLLGFGVSLLLLIQSINSNNPLIKSLCRSGGANDCNVLLKSTAAKITPWLSWSEMGFFYFSGSFLSILIFPDLTPILFWLTIIVLPYTIYSLAYQYKIKNWCLLCCTIQAVLIIKFLVFNLSPISLNINSILNISSIISFFICFLIPISTWGLIKPILLKASLIKTLQRQLRIFKYNSDLFNLALTQQTHYVIDKELLPIVLGNPNAKTVITVVSNPFCGPCRLTHKFLDEWLQENEDFKLQLLFANDDGDNSHAKLARHFISISLSKDRNLILTALNEWYNQSNKRYETWAAKYPITFTDEVRKASANQKAWCKKTEIHHTPTIFINGYKLPESYKIEDLKYLL